MKGHVEMQFDIHKIMNNFKMDLDEKFSGSTKIAFHKNLVAVKKDNSSKSYYKKCNFCSNMPHSPRKDLAKGTLSKSGYTVGRLSNLRMGKILGSNDPISTGQLSESRAECVRVDKSECG